VAALDEADAVLGELPERVDHRVNGVHGGGAGRERRSRVGAPFGCLETTTRWWLCACFAFTTRRRPSLMAGCVGIRFRVTLRDNGPFGAVGGPSHCDELSPMNGKVVLEC
jgi:hypothetical protein